jgi:peptidyl-prolyl cis-trans isomerase C
MTRLHKSRQPRLALQELLREPLTHFVVLGAALFLIYGMLRSEPAPAGTAALPDRRVAVRAADLEILRAGYAAAWKREPGAAELADLTQNFISEQILFQEASTLGLDTDDEVVRRRLIEKMTVLVRPQAPAGEPSESDLRGWYEIYRHRFRVPARIRFEQVFFDPKLRGDAAATGRAALAELGRKGAPEAPPAGMGDPFVLPPGVSERTHTQVAHLYGEGFARALLAVPVGTWSGPLASQFGVHLVRVREREPERVPPFEEARKHARADWLTTQTRGTRAAALQLLPRYHIDIDAAVRNALDGAPALAPFLGRMKIQ